MYHTQLNTTGILYYGQHPLRLNCWGWVMQMCFSKTKPSLLQIRTLILDLNHKSISNPTGNQNDIGLSVDNPAMITLDRLSSVCSLFTENVTGILTEILSSPDSCGEYAGKCLRLPHNRPHERGLVHYRSTWTHASGVVIHRGERLAESSYSSALWLYDGGINCQSMVFLMKKYKKQCNSDKRYVMLFVKKNECNESKQARLLANGFYLFSAAKLRFDPFTIVYQSVQ